jgi:hypothetical protein
MIDAGVAGGFHPFCDPRGDSAGGGNCSSDGDFESTLRFAAGDSGGVHIRLDSLRAPSRALSTVVARDRLGSVVDSRRGIFDIR